MPVPSSLISSKRDAVYWDNYVTYLNSVDKRSPNIGQGKDKPPQTELYIRPFGVQLGTGQHIAANANSQRWSAYGSHFAGYNKADINVGGSETTLEYPIRVAKVMIKTGVGAKRVVKANTTNKPYTTRGGEAGGVPFGTNTTYTEDEVEVYQIIRDRIRTAIGGQFTSVKVSRVKEKIKL